MKGLKLLMLCCLITAIPAVSQDLHFSQFMQSPLNINPSSAGQFDGDFRASAMYRRQWASVTIPYRTFSMAADAPAGLFVKNAKGFGAGLLLNHDEAGDGSLRQLDVRLLLSWRLALDADSVHFIRAGVLSGFTQRSINFNRLTFDNQFTGDFFNPNAPSGEFFDNSRVNYIDAGSGIAYEYVKERKRMEAGLGVFHLNRPDQSFLGENARRPLLFSSHLAGVFAITEKWDLLPGVLFMQQREYRQLNAGAEARVQLENKTNRRYAVGIALHSRIGDAIIPSLALYWNKFRFGVSYDVNISSLRQVSRGRGGTEFSLVYISRRVTAIPQRNSICPVY